MRLTDDQIQAIRQSARQIGGELARVRVFGSRLDDSARGGDLDLMLELPEPVDNPALMAAQLAAALVKARETAGELYKTFHGIKTYAEQNLPLVDKTQ